MTVKKWPPPPRIIRRPELHRNHSWLPVGALDLFLALLLSAICVFAFYKMVYPSAVEVGSGFDNIPHEAVK